MKRWPLLLVLAGCGGGGGAAALQQLLLTTLLTQFALLGGVNAAAFGSGDATTGEVATPVTVDGDATVAPGGTAQLSVDATQGMGSILLFMAGYQGHYRLDLVAPARPVQVDVTIDGAAAEQTLELMIVGVFNGQAGPPTVYSLEVSTAGDPRLCGDRIADLAPAASLVGSETILCCGSIVHASWVENGTSVSYRRSLDGGQTWTTATRLDDRGEVTASVLCCDGQDVYAFWISTGGRDSPQDTFHAAYSADGGANWSAPVLAGTLAHKAGDRDRLTRMTICCEGTTMHVGLLVSTEAGEVEVYAITSAARVQAFGALVLLQSTAAGNRDFGDPPDICCEGNRVHLVWAATLESGDRGGDHDIFLATSRNGGAGWEAPVRLEDGDFAGDSDDRRPSICCDALSIYALWDSTEDRNITLNFSHDAGVSWAGERSVDAGGRSVDSRHGRIACDNQSVYVVWQDNREAGDRDAPDYDICFRRSTNRGRGFGPLFLLDDAVAPPNGNSVFPDLCVDGNNIFVVWRDDREILEHVFANYSTDAGASFTQDCQVDQRTLTTLLGPPRLCCDGDTAFVMWLSGGSVLEAGRFAPATPDRR